jgi:hypothetical protein
VRAAAPGPRRETSELARVDREEAEPTVPTSDCPPFSGHGRHVSALCAHSQTYDSASWLLLLQYDPECREGCCSDAGSAVLRRQRPAMPPPSKSSVGCALLHLQVYPTPGARLPVHPPHFPTSFLVGLWIGLALSRWARLAGRKGGDLAFKSMLTR